MAVSMSSRPSASPGPSVTLRRSPRFDPYKASTAQRAQQRATPRSLKGPLDPSTFAAVPPVIAQKRKRKTSPTTTTTPVDRALRTHTATRGPSSSRKENEAKAAQIAFQCSLKKSTKSSSLVDDAQPRVITKSGTARKHSCIAKGAALTQDAELSTGRSLRPRRRVAGSVIAQTCKTTAASLYRSIVTSILPNSSSKSRKARKAPVSLPVASTSTAQEPPVALTTSAPANLFNDFARSSDSSPNHAFSTPNIRVLKHPTPPAPSTSHSSLSSTPDGLSQTTHTLTTLHTESSAQAALSIPQTNDLASPHVESAEPLSPYQDVVAVPTSPLSSYPAPSTFDTVDMGPTAVSDLQSSPSADDFRLPPSSFAESTSAPTVDGVVASAVPADVSYIDATPQFTSASYPYSPYTPDVPTSGMYASSPSSQFAGTSAFSGTVIDNAMSVDELDQTSRQTEEAMDVSMDSADPAPASESDLGFGFVPQEQVQMQPIQLPEISFIVPPPPAPPAEDYVSPTFWPRHAKLTVEWNMFSKSQQWHECLARIHDELLATPHPVHRKEGNILKRLRVVPEVKPMHEVGHQMNDRSLFVSMSRGRVLEISRRMGADTIRDIVADEAWRYFKRTGVFPPSYARAHLANSSPASATPQTQIQLPQASLESSDMDSRSDEDAIIDFMSEEIYDFELEDEDAMDEDDDLSEDERFDPRLPSRFCVYFPEEEEEDESLPASPDDMPVEAHQEVEDEDTDDDSSCSDDSEDSDDDMELIASTGDAEGCGCSMMQLDLQLPAQEPTSPASLAPKEDLFHVPIGQQVIFAWGDPPQLPTPTSPVPPRPMNISPFSVPLNIPSFASIRLRSLTAVDSFSCDQLPLRGTKADKVVGYCWSPAPVFVQTPELVEHHTRTGSVAVRPPRVYRHAIIKPPEVIKSFLKAAFVEVAQRSLTRKQSTVDLERLRPPLMLDNSSADQSSDPVSLPSTSTVADMSWMAMDESQPQQNMDTSLQGGMSYQASSILEAAYTQVTGTFQPDNVWYDFPPVHHTPPPQMFIQSSSLSNALG